jgi:diguanylate cyclase (GGDEF)-like protein
MTTIRPTILLVDDEPANIQFLYDILKQDFELLYATDGQQALQRASDRQPDLILLDVKMPGMDGYQVCRQLKESPDTCGIPVIFVTAMSSEPDEAHGLEVGAVDYIAKPISPPIVRARTQTHVELKRQRDLLTRIATQDGLTGIANRLRLNEVLAHEWQRCMRGGAPLSLIMIDVDCFKEFNDTYGHLAGDDCLKQIVRILVDVLNRPADMVARYGGEEFTCVLPDTELDGAKYIAQGIRKAIEAQRIEHVNSPFGYVTVSLGIASVTPSPKHQVEELLAQADASLYKAKKAGRNRSEGANLVSTP